MIYINRVILMIIDNHNIKIVIFNFLIKIIKNPKF